MSRVDLPDGAWAELHAPKKVSERKRRSFVNAIADFNRSLHTMEKDANGEVDPHMYGSEQNTLLDIAMDLLTVALVATWSFDVAVTVDSLGDFPTDVFDTLRNACMALQGEVMPHYETDPDPKATTGE